MGFLHLLSRRTGDQRFTYHSLSLDFDATDAMTAPFLRLPLVGRYRYSPHSGNRNMRIRQWVGMIVLTISLVACTRGPGITFNITGRVVDEQGNGVGDATLVMERSFPAGFDGVTTRKRPVRLSEEGEFKVSVKGGLEVVLILEKPGYYRERYGFRLARLEDLYEQPQPIAIEQEVELVLVKIGRLTTLDTRSGVLVDRPGDDDVVFHYEPQRPVRFARRFGNDTYSDFLERSDVAESATDEQRSFVFMKTSRDQEPMSIKMTSVSVAAGFGMWTREVPEKISLHSSIAGTGFIFPEFDDYLPTSSFNFDRKMRTAPETGYLQSVAFDAEDVFEWNNGSSRARGIPFYFFDGEYYGRGVVGFGVMDCVQVSTETGEVSVQLSFQMQADGSRYLETGD